MVLSDFSDVTASEIDNSFYINAQGRLINYTVVAILCSWKELLTMNFLPK